MEVQNLSTGKTLITLSEEEKRQLQLALDRLGQTFQVQVLPAIKQLGAALAAAAPAIRRFAEEAEKAREICQRLDPAFSGPPEETEPVRTIDPVTGQSLLQEESYPIRMLPTVRTPEQIHRDLALQHGWPVPGPGTKADWDD